MSHAMVIVAGEELVLLPERAAYWPRAATLIIADLHLGKAASWRAAGIPLPGGTTDVDLARLGKVARETQCERIVILGDVIHAQSGLSKPVMERWASWQEGHEEVRIEAVLGNHDGRLRREPLPGLTLRGSPLHIEPFVLQHKPATSPYGYVLAGHVHPGVALGRGREVILRLPCFAFGPGRAILPAFTSFSGTATQGWDLSGKIFVIADDEVIPWQDQTVE